MRATQPKNRRALLTVGVGAVLLFAATAAGVDPTQKSPTPGTEVSGKAWETFQLLNDLRRAGFRCPEGQYFPPNAVDMLFDCRLWMASVLHSIDMVENHYFSHYGLDGSTPWDRAEEQGVHATGENIAAGYPSAQSAMEGWKQSDGHCRNMMNPRSTVVAVGYASGGDYGHYWTQMMGHFDDVDTSCYPPVSMLRTSQTGALVLDGGERLGDACTLENCTGGL